MALFKLKRLCNRHDQILFRRLFQIHFLALVFSLLSVSIDAADPRTPDDKTIEIVAHAWRPDVVWEKIGKTKFIWNATVRNHSSLRKRVFVYYDLLDSENIPLARNVANATVGPGQTVEITSDSYIDTPFLSQVKSGRAIVKVGFPN